MLKSTKSQTYITPLRVRSSSREQAQNDQSSHHQGSASMLSKYSQLKEQIDANYIGLRMNRNHATCELKRQLPPKQKSIVQGQNPDLSNAMRQLNMEMQRFIDSDLQHALSQIKNDMDDKQYEFEKQMCTLFSKLSKDLPQNTQLPQQQLTSVGDEDFALKSDLKDLENFTVKMLEDLQFQMDDNFKKMTLENQLALQKQRDDLETNWREDQERQDREREDLQRRVEALEASFRSVDKRLADKEKEEMQRGLQMDKDRDEWQRELRKLRQEMKDGVEGVRKEGLKREEGRGSGLEKGEVEEICQEQVQIQIQEELEKLRSSLSPTITQLQKDLEVLETLQNNDREKLQELSNSIPESVNEAIATISLSLDQNRRATAALEEKFAKQDKLLQIDLQKLRELDELLQQKDSLKALEELQERVKKLERDSEINLVVDSLDSLVKVLDEKLGVQIEQSKAEFEKVWGKLQGNKDQERRGDLNVEIRQYLEVKLEEIWNVVNEQGDQGNQMRDDFDEFRRWVKEQVERIDSKDFEQDQRLNNLEKQQSETGKSIKEIHKKDAEQDSRLGSLEQSISTFQSELAGCNSRIKSSEQNLRQELAATTASLQDSLVAILTEHPSMQQQEQSPQKQLTEQEEAERKKEMMLAEMRRRRNLYLRKTPQDLIIEQIMLENRCSQQKAEEIYLNKLADSKKIIQSSNQASPARPTQNQLGLKSIYDNIIHARSPSRGGEIRLVHVFDEIDGEVVAKVQKGPSNENDNEKKAQMVDLVNLAVSKAEWASHQYRENSASKTEVIKTVVVTDSETSSPERKPITPPKIIINSPEKSAKKSMPPLSALKVSQQKKVDIDESNVDSCDLEDEEDQEEIKDNFSILNQSPGIVQPSLHNLTQRSSMESSRFNKENKVISFGLHTQRSNLESPFSKANQNDLSQVMYEVGMTNEESDEHKNEDELDELEEIEDAQDREYEGSQVYDYTEEVKMRGNSDLNKIQSRVVNYEELQNDIEEEEEDPYYQEDFEEEGDY